MHKSSIAVPSTSHQLFCWRISERNTTTLQISRMAREQLSFSSNKSVWRLLVPMALLMAMASAGPLVSNRFFNSSPPSARYMRRWTGSALVQVMDCRRKGITWTNVNYTLRKSFIANLIVCESMAILNYGRWDNALPKWALFEDEISKCPFIKRERLGLDQNFTDVCSWGFKWQCLHICSHSWTGDKPESGWLSNLLRHISVTRHQCVIKVDATCVRNFQFRCWKLNAGYIYILLIYI